MIRALPPPGLPVNAVGSAAGTTRAGGLMRIRLEDFSIGLRAKQNMHIREVDDSIPRGYRLDTWMLAIFGMFTWPDSGLNFIVNMQGRCGIWLNRIFCNNTCTINIGFPLEA